MIFTTMHLQCIASCVPEKLLPVLLALKMMFPLLINFVVMTETIYIAFIWGRRPPSQEDQGNSQQWMCVGSGSGVGCSLENDSCGNVIDTAKRQ
jgi:hypothetical protein